MEWLMIIVFIVVSIMDSKKKSDQAKQKREQRMQTDAKPVQKPMQPPIQKTAQKPVQKTMEQQVYRTGDGTAKQQARPQYSYQPKPSAEKQPEGPWYESFGELLKDLGTELKDLSEDLSKEFTLDSDQVPNPMQKSSPKKTVAASAPKKKAKSDGTAKKSPADLPTKTLMEQRHDREQREEHKKVTASVKPLTASVKPIKNAFENDEHCEHRIELNPNIQYSNRKQQTDLQRAAIVKTDSESLIQGVIWSEILGKPRAHQPMEQRFRRR